MIHYLAAPDPPISGSLPHSKNERVNSRPQQRHAVLRAVEAFLQEPQMVEKVNLADELVASMEEGLAILRGEKEASRVHLPPDWPDVRAIRAKTGLTREAFAARFGLKVAAVRGWEQGLRRPAPAAHTLLRVIEKEPEAVERALRVE